jgi:hypothetical protein
VITVTGLELDVAHLTVTGVFAWLKPDVFFIEGNRPGSGHLRDVALMNRCHH